MKAEYIDRWIRLAPQEAETKARRVFGYKGAGRLQGGRGKKVAKKNG